MFERCKYLRCNNGYQNGYKLFRFPYWVERQKTWVEHSGNPHLSRLAVTTIRRAGLCSEHFKDEDFMDPQTKKSLRRNRVPIHWTEVKESNTSNVKSSNAKDKETMPVTTKSVPTIKQIILSNTVPKEKQYIQLQPPSSTSTTPTDKTIDKDAASINRIILSNAMPKDKQFIILQSPSLTQKSIDKSIVEPTDKPTIKPIDKSTNGQTDKPTFAPIGKLVVKSMDQLMDKSTIALTSKSKVMSAYKPTIDQTIDKPADILITKPTDNLITKPEPTVTSPNKSTVAPIGNLTSKLTLKPFVRSTDKPKLTPNVKLMVKPTVASMDKSILTPIHKPLVKLIGKPTIALTDKSTFKPTHTLIVHPMNKMIVKPIVQPIAKTTVQPIVQTKIEPIVDTKIEPIVQTKIEPIVQPTIRPTVPPTDTANSESVTNIVYVRVPTEAVKATPNVERVDAAVSTQDLEFITTLYRKKGRSPKQKVESDADDNIFIPGRKSLFQTLLSAKTSMCTYQAKIVKLEAKLKKLRSVIKTEKTRTSRLQKRIDKLKLRRFDLDEYLENNEVPELARTMIKLQVHRKNTPYTQGEKELAKMLYHHSIPLYLKLRKGGLLLPGGSTVRNEFVMESQQCQNSDIDEDFVEEV